MIYYITYGIFFTLLLFAALTLLKLSIEDNKEVDEIIKSLNHKNI